MDKVGLFNVIYQTKHRKEARMVTILICIFCGVIMLLHYTEILIFNVNFLVIFYYITGVALNYSFKDQRITLFDHKIEIDSPSALIYSKSSYLFFEIDYIEFVLRGPYSTNKIILFLKEGVIEGRCSISYKIPCDDQEIEKIIKILNANHVVARWR